MYSTPSNMLKHSALVAFVAALGLTVASSQQASGDLSPAAQIKLPPAAPGKVDYQQDIQPLLAQKCYSCHGPEVQQAGLRLDLRQNALRGGDYGPVIKIGDSASSKLIRRLVAAAATCRCLGALSDGESGWCAPGSIRAQSFANIVAESQANDTKITADRRSACVTVRSNGRSPRVKLVHGR
jgi:hypothetical protein